MPQGGAYLCLRCPRNGSRPEGNTARPQNTRAAFSTTVVSTALSTFEAFESWGCSTHRRRRRRRRRARARARSPEGGRSPAGGGAHNSAGLQSWLGIEIRIGGPTADNHVAGLDVRPSGCWNLCSDGRPHPTRMRGMQREKHRPHLGSLCRGGPMQGQGPTQSLRSRRAEGRRGAEGSRAAAGSCDRNSAFVSGQRQRKPRNPAPWKRSERRGQTSGWARTHAAAGRGAAVRCAARSGRALGSTAAWRSRKERRCLSHEGSGNARRRRCLSHEGSGNTLAKGSALPLARAAAVRP